MKKIFKQLIVIALIGIALLKVEQIKAIVPEYYLPRTKNLKKESITLGKNAYQLLYFGQIVEGLNLAKLAITINNQDENLWLILAEAQIANNLLKEALISLNNAEKINNNIGELYFAKSNIYLKQSKLEEAIKSLESGLKIQPDNFKALFQLGNIYLMQNNYVSSIKKFEGAVLIKKDFWQALNNIGLAYFEKDKINLSITFFQKAISIEKNAEPLLALASCMSYRDINKAISLAKKALIKDPKYVNYDYRKEQLWGDKLQERTEKLFKNIELQKAIILAKSKINLPS